ncbi:MAG: hypothetical protein IJE81_05350 [Oscillospiraceae bacterium]|nr:hypothetical protein [Oscillospiraceae bacterium]
MTNQKPDSCDRFPKFLTGNALKLIAAAAMTIDHIGVMLFPRVLLLRIIGRLALPIFAFMIAEGCKYTRNRKKYFGMIFALGLACQTVYYLVDGSMYLSILLTFSLSILTIYALDHWKHKKTALSALVFAGTVAAVYGLNQVLTFDYGFWGCMLPVFAALAHGTDYDCDSMSSALLGLGLIPLFFSLGSIQFFSFLALPLLYAYNGKKGQLNLKYFFYIFYPVHLAALQGIAWLIG